MFLEEKLLLLIPDRLLSIHQHDKLQEIKLSGVLSLLHTAILETSLESALTTIEEAMKILEPLEVNKCSEVLDTNVLLEFWEIEDFDTFFQIEHVETQEPTACLLMSILTAYKTWIQLVINNDSAMAAQELEIQKQGFKSCANLLARIFNVSLEKYGE